MSKTMRRNDGVLTPPPQSFMAVQQSTLHDQQQLASSKNSKTDSLNPSIIVAVLLIVAAIIVTATVYLFHRCFSLYRRLRDHRSSTFRIDGIASDSLRHFQGSERRDAFLVDSLPLFTFSSLTGTISGGDCAVCLSKFEPHDQLRLLPVCCHAFHANCIDAWLATSQTCPLCRSSIIVSESEVMSKILASAPPNSAPMSGGESFRVEIGSVSRRHLPSDSGIHRRSYSIGSFEYILDDVQSEVTVSTIHGISEAGAAGDKSGRLDESSIYVVAPPGETLAAEVAGGEERGRSNWLKDYVDRIARTASFSVSSSFRSSGRFFVGSSRRTEAFRVHEADLEASRLGDEIGEMFRWLSTV